MIKSHILVKFNLIILFIHSIAFGQIIIPGGIESEIIKDEILFNSDNKHIFKESIICPDSLNYNLPFLKTLSQKPFQFFSPEFRTTFNSAYPRGYNDGVIWKGRGITSEMHLGAYGKLGAIHYSFIPAIYFSENRSYQLPPYVNRNPYNYQFRTGGGIDWVQRYGPKSFFRFNLGQSEIRIIKNKFTAGISNQNFSLGPLIQNPILLSKNSPGFPHLDIGSIKPFEIWPGKKFGKINGRFFMGILRESQYFDENPDNDLRFINGFNIEYELPFLHGFNVGANRVLYKNTEYFEFNDLFSAINKIREGADTLNDLFDQMASLYVDWFIQEVNMRLYFEYAKNDFTGSRSILVDTDHSRAYSFGVQRGFELSSTKKIILYMEHLTLERNKGYLYRPVPPYYIHSFILQGYTNDGQVLGAGTGPGSNSQILGLNYYSDQKRLSFHFQRIEFNEDHFIVTHDDSSNNSFNADLHDVEYTIGFKYSKTNKHLSYGLDLDLSYRLNMYYQFKNDMVNFSPGAYVKFLLP